jgi:sulfate adenylyltransferase
MMDGLIAPHGGELVINMASEQERTEWQGRAKSMPHLQVGSRQLADLEMLATGAYSPLGGFMERADYLSVVNDMHLGNGLPWSIPITLTVSSEQAATLREDTQVALVDARGSMQAVMTINEKFGYDKQHEASKVYRTLEEAHPGVKALYRQGDVLLGGPVRVVALQEQAFARYRYTPIQSRRMFAERGWKRVVGFQTRNPVHRAHEYIQKCALETVDGLYLHPLVGDTKEDDIPAPLRMRCYEVLLEHYYPADRVILGVLPAAMRYAGPREAVFHALMRKNYGCSHFIVGRDHAGVGNYYGTYDAQHIFAEIDPTRLGITPMFFEHTFFCLACDSMASSKTCPHGNEHHVALSGTRVRQMLQNGEAPPREFSRPEVARALIEGMRQVQKGAVNQVQLVLGSELDREPIKQVLTEGGSYDK